MSFKKATAEEIRKKHFAPLIDLARIFHHEIGTFDDDGTLRFKPNAIVSELPRDVQGIHDRLGTGEVSIEEMMKFYMQIGYTLCGFGEIFSDGDTDHVAEMLEKYAYGEKELRI